MCSVKLLVHKGIATSSFQHEPMPEKLAKSPLYSCLTMRLPSDIHVNTHANAMQTEVYWRWCQCMPVVVVRINTQTADTR